MLAHCHKQWGRHPWAMLLILLLSTPNAGLNFTAFSWRLFCVVFFFPFPRIVPGNNAMGFFSEADLLSPPHIPCRLPWCLWSCCFLHASVIAVGNGKDYAKLTDFHHHPQRSQVYHSCAVLLPQISHLLLPPQSARRVKLRIAGGSSCRSAILCHTKLLTHVLPAPGL